ncbi:MAG: hypothetical protein HKN82_15015 [Akkermansiaceae bacterium]|nr:hypothetical protein [Akkermansiaceae bacterium]NNM31316.1 hypothetical protein [Akkermansiaceae bacterium]
MILPDILKFGRSLTPLAVAIGLSVAIGGEAGAEEEVRVPPTNRDLQFSKLTEKKAQKHRPAVTQLDPGKIRSLERDRRGLVERSTILSAGGLWTIVPKGAVIHTPNRLSSRVDTEPKGRLVSWHSFYARNYGWIRTHEVSMEQACGKEELPGKLADALRTGGKVVVAVRHKGPISMKTAHTKEAAEAEPKG